MHRLRERALAGALAGRKFAVCTLMGCDHLHMRDEKMAWTEAAARLAAARNYWLGTTTPDADPSFDVVYAIRPQSAMTWCLADYEGSQRRWSA